MSTAFFGSCAPAVPPGPPVPLADMYSWLKAGSGIQLVGGDVDRWYNAAPIPAYEYVEKVASRPVFVSSWTNGQPAVGFSAAGTTNLGSVTPFTVAEPMTHYLVLDASSSGGIMTAANMAVDYGILGSIGMYLNTGISGAASLASPSVVALVMKSQSGADSEIWVNNLLVVSGDIGNGSQEGLFLGSAPTPKAYISMNLGEQISYSVAHDTATREAVQTYLANKYNITLA